MRDKLLVLWLVAAAAPALAADFVAPQAGTITASWSASHEGLDVAGPPGARVAAARAGRVIFAGASPVYGTLVVLAHDAGYTTHYGRLGAASRAVGTQVRAGATIGSQGAAGGGEQGAHLHFEIRRYGTRQHVPGARASRVARGAPVPRRYVGLSSARGARAAADLLRYTAVPNLETSSAYRIDRGDNLARMRLVRRRIGSAVGLLLRAQPAAAAAADLLRTRVIPVLEAAPGYRLILAANPNAFAETRLGMAREALAAALAALPAAPPPPPAPAPVAPHWEQAGVFIWHATAFSPHWHGDLMLRSRVAWVAVQVHDGLAVEAANDAAFASGWLDVLRAKGIVVGAWGVNRTEPEAEAALAARLVAQRGFAFYIANAEMEYKYTQNDGSGSAEAYGRSARFVRAFRALAPAVPAGVSSYGRADMADIDWAAWRSGGFVWLPQAYWNDHDIYEPVACADGAVRAGWPRSHTFPTIGIWGGGQRGYVSAATYVDRLRLAGTRGFSVYLGETMPLGEWPVLGAGIASGIAR